MSFIGVFNKPKMLLFDEQDYAGSGHIGVTSGSVSATIKKEMDWDTPYVTFRATFDAHTQAIKEYIFSVIAAFTEEYVLNIDPWEAEYSSIDISSENKIKFINAANDIMQKNFELHVQSKIFWNQFTTDYKLSGNQTLTRTLVVFNNVWTSSPWYEDVEFSREVNFDIYQELTSDIYQNYINAVKEYMFSIKYFLKLATNSDFEEIQFPFDFETSFLPS